VQKHSPNKNEKIAGKLQSQFDDATRLKHLQ